MMIPGCLPIFIKNKDPADTLYLYGDTGVQINAYGANNPMQVLSGSGVLLLVESTTQLHSVPS